MSVFLKLTKQKQYDKQNIFKLIDEYTKENNNKFIEFIKNDPLVVNSFNNNGISVYSYATLKNIDCLRDLHETYKKYAKVKNIPEPYEFENKITNNRPIHHAVEKSLINQLEYLMNDIKVDVNAQNKDGDTPLHIACKFGNKKMVEALLDNKLIKLDILNKDSNTPLYIASIRKYKRIVEMLLDKGAKFKVIKKGKTMKFEFNIYNDILDKQNEYPEIVKIFKKHKKLRRHKEKVRFLTNEYKYVCSSLQNDVNNSSIKILANHLKIKLKPDLSKKELCKKMAEKIVIYAQNPELFDEDS
jgi:ankyrin repeat protein